MVIAGIGMGSMMQVLRLISVQNAVSRAKIGFRDRLAQFGRRMALPGPGDVGRNSDHRLPPGVGAGEQRAYIAFRGRPESVSRRCNPHRVRRGGGPLIAMHFVHEQHLHAPWTRCRRPTTRDSGDRLTSMTKTSCRSTARTMSSCGSGTRSRPPSPTSRRSVSTGQGVRRRSGSSRPCELCVRAERDSARRPRAPFAATARDPAVTAFVSGDGVKDIALRASPDAGQLPQGRSRAAPPPSSSRTSCTTTSARSSWRRSRPTATWWLQGSES